MTAAGRVWAVTVATPLAWDAWTVVHAHRYPERELLPTASSHFDTCRRGPRGWLVVAGSVYLVVHLMKWLPARFDPLRAIPLVPRAKVVAVAAETGAETLREPSMLRCVFDRARRARTGCHQTAHTAPRATEGPCR